MFKTLNLICAEINNYFAVDKIFDKFEIKDGKLTTDNINVAKNQYFRIVGSMFNDGIYQHPDTNLIDESFDGAIWLMIVPQDILDLSKKIEEWEANHAKQAESPYQSESLNPYSYSLKTGSDGKSFTWKDAFANQLKTFRKLCAYR